MAYDKQTWIPERVGGTPLSAARFQHMEEGIGGAHDLADSAKNRANHIGTQSSATISDFVETVQGAVGDQSPSRAVVYGTNVDATQLPDGTLVIEFPAGLV